MAFATWDSNNKNANITLSNGDLTAKDAAGQTGNVRATMGASSGKYYWECEVDVGGNLYLGIALSSVNLASSTRFDNLANTYVYFHGGGIYESTIFSLYGSTFGVGDVIGFALDLDNGAIWYSKNGVWQGGATVGEIESENATNAATTGLSGEFFPAVCLQHASAAPQVTAAFDPDTWAHSAPSGFQSFGQGDSQSGSAPNSIAKPIAESIGKSISE